MKKWWCSRHADLAEENLRFRGKIVTTMASHLRKIVCCLFRSLRTPHHSFIFCSCRRILQAKYSSIYKKQVVVRRSTCRERVCAVATRTCAPSTRHDGLLAGGRVACLFLGPIPMEILHLIGKYWPPKIAHIMGHAQIFSYICTFWGLYYGDLPIKMLKLCTHRGYPVFAQIVLYFAILVGFVHTSGLRPPNMRILPIFGLIGGAPTPLVGKYAHLVHWGLRPNGPCPYCQLTLRPNGHAPLLRLGSSGPSGHAQSPYWSICPFGVWANRAIAPSGHSVHWGSSRAFGPSPNWTFGHLVHCPLGRTAFGLCAHRASALSVHWPLAGAPPLGPIVPLGRLPSGLFGSIAHLGYRPLGPMGNGHMAGPSGLWAICPIGPSGPLPKWTYGPIGQSAQCPYANRASPDRAFGPLAYWPFGPLAYRAYGPSAFGRPGLRPLAQYALWPYAEGGRPPFQNPHCFNGHLIWG